MDETWKAVEGFPGYEVSDHGRVRSLRPHPMKRYPGGHVLAGYLKRHKGRPVCVVVNLVRGGKVSTVRVHRLVLTAFKGDAPAGTEGCHNDGDPSNNRLTNLRWDTHAANQADQVTHGTQVAPPLKMGASHHKATLSTDEVAYIRARPAGDAAELAARFGVSRKTIYRIKRGETRLLG